MIRKNRMHRINPLFALLRFYLRVRTREFHAKKVSGKTALRILRRLAGWACFMYPPLTGTFPRFRWFSAKAAKDAEGKRNELLDRLYGRVASAAGGSKLHTGPLSPGCTHCIRGDWACNFINRLCNRDCFFCKRSHRMLKEEPEPETSGYPFTHTSEHICYLKTFNIRGVSFSGGEPLLVRDRLLEHVRAVRREFGDSMHIWMYTNGDLADDDVLRQLQQAGLNEIRFNIAAREYDLSPLILAKKYIPVVTVEIPCIPEDLEKLKSLLPVMEKEGVNFLNIHQLSVEEQNCRELIRHEYHFTGIYPGISVYESEIAALELLLLASETGIKLPINYCSSVYKYRYQGRGFRKQLARPFPSGFEEMTDTGYLRRISVSASPGQIRDLASRLETECGQGVLWDIEGDGKRITMHSSLAPHIDWSCSTVDVTYLKPGVSPGSGSGKPDAGNLRENKKTVYETRGLDQSLFDLWNRLYIKKEIQNSNLGEFSTFPTKRTKQDEILRMKNYELQQQGFPEIL